MSYPHSLQDILRSWCPDGVCLECLRAQGVVPGEEFTPCLEVEATRFRAAASEVGSTVRNLRFLHPDSRSASAHEPGRAVRSDC